MSFKITSLVLGSYYANCYIITDEESGKNAVVDPGFYGETFKEKLLEWGYGSFEYVLLTHGHYDHILGASGFKENFGAKIVIHEDDADFLSDDSKSLAHFLPKDYIRPEADITLKDGDSLNLGETQIKVLHTPGHTKGSVCYILGDTILSGDTLFCGEIGRCDLPTGDFETMKNSLSRLYNLQGDYNVLTGHGESTTLSSERRNNPYMKGLK